jgi:hypothetical protein
MTDKVQEREAVCQEIKGAFEGAGVGAIVQNYPGMPYAWVAAYINHYSGWHSRGQGWQRQALVIIPDDRDEIDVFMSGLYELPAGKRGSDVQIDQLPLLFKLPLNDPALAGEIVNRIRQASLESAETIEVKTIQPPPPPVPLDSLNTLADLINVHEQYYARGQAEQYHAWLKQILSKLGKVHYKGEEWFVGLGGHLCHTETAPESAPVTGPDGEPVIYTNAEYIRLDAYRDLI